MVGENIKSYIAFYGNPDKNGFYEGCKNDLEKLMEKGFLANIKEGPEEKKISLGSSFKKDQKFKERFGDDSVLWDYLKYFSKIKGLKKVFVIRADVLNEDEIESIKSKLEKKYRKKDVVECSFYDSE